MNKTSIKIKRFFEHFQKHNKNVKFPSLKAYVRSLLKTGNDQEKELAKVWFSNKGGALERVQKEKRLKEKGPTLKLIALATKSAKRKKKGPGGS